MCVFAQCCLRICTVSHFRSILCSALHGLQLEGDIVGLSFDIATAVQSGQM